MQIATGCPEQVTVFDDLGVCQLLSELGNIGAVEVFIHRWLGGLLDYDTAKNAQLVDTLYRYLECGGNYDLTAKALSLHRSTLRYRLQRIRVCPVTTSTTPTPGLTCSSRPGLGRPCTPCVNSPNTRPAGQPWPSRRRMDVGYCGYSIACPWSWPSISS
jgi:PucR C-terminal helix-turn-helix domain